MYEVGKPFPVNNLADGTEKCVASFNEKFIDLQVYVIPQTGDVKAMKSGPIKYGMFEYQNVPFFLIDFVKTFSFDAPLNFLKTQEDKQEDWLNEEANLMTIYCIHALTNEILAIRAIGLKRDFCEEIRDCLEKQLKKYKEISEVDAKITIALSKYTNDIMIANSKMIRL
jgi:hypothetical protein